MAAKELIWAGNARLKVIKERTKILSTTDRAVETSRGNVFADLDLAMPEDVV